MAPHEGDMVRYPEASIQRKVPPPAVLKTTAVESAVKTLGAVLTVTVRAGNGSMRPSRASRSR